VTNPFTPTPLGKDWTPPKPPDPPSEEAESLGNLFEDAGAGDAGFGEPAGDQPQTPATGGLGDLFSGTQPADVPAEGATGGLGDLFRVADQPATDKQTAEPDTNTLRPRVKRRGLVGTIAVDNTPETTSNNTAESAKTEVGRNSTDDAGAATAKDPSADGAAAAGSNRAPEPQPDNRRRDRSGGRPEQSAHTPGTDAPEQPRQRSSQPAGQPQTARVPRKNVQENERIWTLVDQTLALIGADSTLQRLAQSVELTQDLTLYSRQRGELEAALRPRMASSGVTISGPADIEKIIARVHDELSGISVLGDLWRDPSVDEILVDRWDVVNVERNGRLETTEVTFRSHQHAEGTARSLALKISDRAVSRSIPLVTAELPGARVTFAFGAVVKGGLSVTIRKFKKLLELSDLLRFGSLNEEIVDFLRDAVLARGSVLVSGGTGTGKTTIINLLSTFIPDDERVITIEDAFELKLANTHVVSLQTKEASSSDDTVSVTLANLLRNTLRMRPDRIIVGEIREGEGAMVMLAAANTGHDGTITTIHANSVGAALNERFPDLVRQARSNRDDDAIQRSIAGAFDLAIQITRGRSGRRYVSEIAVICGVDRDTGMIETETVFSGEEHHDGVRFQRRVIRSETEFVRRLDERSDRRWTS